MPSPSQGHSLGGALATLTALGLQQRGVVPAGVFTFGSPRVGQASFTDLYDASGLTPVTYRIVNERDPVTKVPPESGLSKLGNYRHVGQPWVCDDAWNEGCRKDGQQPSGATFGDHMMDK